MDRKDLFAALLVLFFSLVTMNASADDPNDILVIANKSVALESISAGQLVELFLKKAAVIDSNNIELIPINAPEGSPLREAWAKRALGMDGGSEISYWKKLLVKSGTQEPKSVTNPMAAVFTVKGAVGYVNRADYKDGLVKILAVIAP